MHPDSIGVHFFYEQVMKCIDIIKFIDDWAPKKIAWEKDNVGLQVGNSNSKVKNILLALDLNEKVIDDAIKNNCNFIFTHHPILFHPLKTIDTCRDKTAKLIELLIKNNITVYSAHTNLDFTKDGVSFMLAKKIKLEKVTFLKNLANNLLKLIVFVPEKNLEEVADAIHKEGGGIIGEYTHCSFRTEGKGTFLASSKSKPAVGKREVLENVNEIKLEVLVENWKLKNVLYAMIKAHPYEEIAYDVYPLKNENVNYGIGAIGYLKIPIPTNSFLQHVSKSLKAKGLRYTAGKSKMIKKVAVVGGSGSELLNTAIKQNADAFITADIRYHTFQEAERNILLVDAGHYETESPVLDEVQKRLTKFLSEKKKIKILKYKGSTNPVIFYNN